MPAAIPRIAPPPDSDIWQPGDLAEMIGDGSKWVNAETGRPSPGPASNQILYVVAVQAAECPCGCKRPVQFLVFERFSPEAYAANWFVKIAPRADAAKAGKAVWLNRFVSTPIKQPEIVPCDS